MDPEAKVLAADAIAGAALSLPLPLASPLQTLQKTLSTLFSGLVGWPF
jgi:hypothetical protein